MEKTSRNKPKTKKQTTPKPKTTKKRKSDGPTCSSFLSELTRRFAIRRKEVIETPANIIQTIIDSITNALPIKISVKSLPPPPAEAAVSVKHLILSPQLSPSDAVPEPSEQSPEQESRNEVYQDEGSVMSEYTAFKMPKMPVIDSEELKVAAEQARRRHDTAEAGTCTQHDVAAELARHVTTLKRISLIAEEFNQKTAKNLKEIVASVQEDLIKKLEEVQAQQKGCEPSLVFLEQQNTTCN